MPWLYNLQHCNRGSIKQQHLSCASNRLYPPVERYLGATRTSFLFHSLQSSLCALAMMPPSQMTQTPQKTGSDYAHGINEMHARAFFLLDGTRPHRTRPSLDAAPPLNLTKLPGWGEIVDINLVKISSKNSRPCSFYK
jgi:hypothetical protein